MSSLEMSIGNTALTFSAPKAQVPSQKEMEERLAKLKEKDGNYINMFYNHDIIMSLLDKSGVIY